jgi:hypothetical protein
MMEGSEFDKKMDEMFERMAAQGMTEDQILDNLMGDMEVKEKANGEMSFDPSKLNVDPEIFKAFSSHMEEKANSPEV